MPFGIEYQNFDYPVQESYQTETFGPLFGPQNTPALNSYQDYLMGAPRREDYGGNFLTKLMAGIAGASAGYKNPAAGIQTALSIQDIPYMNALREYQSLEPSVRNAALIEERQLNDKNAYLRMLQQQKFDQAKLAQENQLKQQDFGLRQQQFGLDQQEFGLERQKFALDQAYKNGQLTNEQYANATARINALANQSQSAAMTNYYNARAADPDLDALGNSGMNSGLAKLQIQQAVQSDPLLHSAFDDKGRFHPEELDEMQLMRYSQLLRQYGLAPSLDIGLR